MPRRTRPYKHFETGSKTWICPECGEDKPLSEFGTSNKAKSGAQTYCKPCTRDRNVEWRKANPHLTRAAYLRHKKSKPASTPWNSCSRRAKKSGTPLMHRKDFVEWYENQEKVCSYCQMSEEDALDRFKHRLHVDRMESRLGYMPGNICLACQRCNATKNGYLTADQMKVVAKLFF